ncbi:hypothetical protein [Oricola sp.]|uniref:hypothetical protein n=1 Tax=Oricola sp. TaxID=1979950 RepID=UPI003BAA2913
MSIFNGAMICGDLHRTWSALDALPNASTAKILEHQLRATAKSATLELETPGD